MHQVHKDTENSTRKNILSRLRNKPSKISSSVNLKNSTNSHATKFEPACLLEKRKDDKTPINILLLLPNITLGKSYIEALKDYEKISKLHASLTYINGSWYIRDSKSANGVYLNLRKIKGPTKVDFWSVIGLGGSYISEDVFTAVLCPLYKEIVKILPRSRTDIYLEYKSSSKTNSTTVSKEDGATATEFKPALLLEKRSDDKTAIDIPLAFPNVILGSGCIKNLKKYKNVSKLHASLSYVNGSWFIKDLESANGIFLNLKKIGENPVEVDFWSVIQLGGSCISDDVFTCVLCPYNKALAENVTSISTVNYFKDKVTSKINDVSSMKINSEEIGDLCEGKTLAEDKTLPEFSQDDEDDAKSTTSSVESMDIIMYPSASVLSNIEKSRKM